MRGHRVEKGIKVTWARLPHTLTINLLNSDYFFEFLI